MQGRIHDAHSFERQRETETSNVVNRHHYMINHLRKRVIRKILPYLTKRKNFHSRKMLGTLGSMLKIPLNIILLTISIAAVTSLKF